MKKRKDQFENPYFDYGTNQHEQQGNQYDYNAKQFESNSQPPYNYNPQQYIPDANRNPYEGNLYANVGEDRVQ